MRAFLNLRENSSIMHRVQKLLSNYGYCSRRKAEDLIAEGRVKVNDKIISLGDKASEKDEIKVTRLAHEAVAKKYSVRQLEQIIKKKNIGKSEKLN